VIRGQKVQWMPAVDVNQIVVGCQALAVALFLLGRRRRRHRGRPGPPHVRVVEPAFGGEAVGAPGLQQPDGAGGPPSA
jgi:hypothetical protein